MRTEYRLWHKTTGRQSYKPGALFGTRELAAETTDQPNLGLWNIGGDPENRWVDTDSGHWLITEERVPESDTDKVELALDLALTYGQIDGEHHKTWVIDQMVRTLTGDEYEQVITRYRDGIDGPETYSWDEGIAP